MDVKFMIQFTKDDQILISEIVNTLNDIVIETGQPFEWGDPELDGCS